MFSESQAILLSQKKLESSVEAGVSTDPLGIIDMIPHPGKLPEQPTEPPGIEKMNDTSDTLASAKDILAAEKPEPILQDYTSELNKGTSEPTSACRSGRSPEETSGRSPDDRSGRSPDETLNSVETTVMDNKPVKSTNKMLEQFGDVQSSTLQLGALDISSHPETEDPPEVVGYINGHEARILIDSGCSTYVLSSAFALKTRIQQHPTNPIPVQLAVRNSDDDPRITLKTPEIPVTIGDYSTKKAFYTLPLPRYDAILGLPFIKENKISFGESHVMIGSQIVPMNNERKMTPQIGMVSRQKLKSLVRRNQLDELYLCRVEVAKSDSSEPRQISEPIEKKLTIPSKIPEWIQREYADIFLEGLPPGMPPPRSVDHQILLKDPNSAPPFKGIFRLSQLELYELRKQLDNLLKDGKISPSTSPYGAPVLFVRKKNNELRMCIDYRALNSQTIKNRYALPRIDELLDRLFGARIFTKIDLTSGYWQIAISPADRHKTAFRTRYGHYEFQVMPFGLTNAPATFQSLMNDIFRDLLDKCVIVYLDDILIYSKTPEEHKANVREVLNRLRQHKLYAKGSKCEFDVLEVEYLGHIINSEGVQPNPKLVKAITTFPQPTTLKELQSFLGLANYYRKFVKDFSKLALPLTDGLQRASINRPLDWTTTMEIAFQQIKIALTSVPCLILPDPDGDFDVTTDASEDEASVGAVLTQNGHPVAFESKKLDKHQRNYPVHDKEMFAIMHAIRKWRPFLLGKPFHIYTDHRSLVHFKTQPRLNQRQIRWMEEIADYDCEILYKPGKENVVADALSRIHINALTPVTSRKVLNEIYGGYKEQPFKDLFMAVERGGGTTNRYTIQQKLLYYRVDEYESWRLVLPDIPYRQKVIHENHNLAIAGHPGFVQTYSKMARLYYWPGMSKDVRKHVQECDECQRTKPSTQPPSGKLEPMPIPGRPWQSIGMDFLGTLRKSRKGNDMILAVVDRLTKMAHFIPTKSTISSSQVADLFVEHIFRYHGMPESIVSDRDPRFTAKFWKNLNKALGINLLMSTAAHPQTDGQSEATVKVIQKLLRPFCLQEQDWEMLLPSLEFAYNDTQHTSTGQTPFYLNYGHHPTGTYRHDETTSPHVEDRIKYLLRLQEAARDALHDAQSIQERYANKHRRPVPDIKVDDWVLLRRKKEDKRKLAPIADGPFKVIAVRKNAVTLKFPQNTRAHPTVNVSRVQLYFGPRPERFTEPPNDDTNHDYVVERVLGQKTVDGQEYFYIHWKGYPAEDDSWEPRSNLSPETLQLWQRTNQRRQQNR
jgi:hypothetical protein